MVDIDIARDKGELLRKVRALIEALHFYADEENWQWQERGAWADFEPEKPAAYQDAGKTASDAMETVRTAPLLTEYLDAIIARLEITAEMIDCITQSIKLVDEAQAGMKSGPFREGELLTQARDIMRRLNGEEE